MNTVLSRFGLVLARLCSAMWVGAALLFVLTSIAEQVQPSFDTATKDTLALVRFPWYYGLGTALLIAALLGAVCSGLRWGPRLAAAMLLLGALGVMAADYAFVYQPLRELLTPPGAERDVAFGRLHRWSEQINGVGFVLSAAAAGLLCAAREGALPRGRS